VSLIWVKLFDLMSKRNRPILRKLNMKIFHVSDDPHIEVFEPRPSPSSENGVTGNAVWAIDEVHLPNYLLPRDCPRVAYVDPVSSGCRTIAVEAQWFERIQNSRLYLYEFDLKHFKVCDSNAGYYIARVAVTPAQVTPLENLLNELLIRKVELRFLPNLWKLRNQIAASNYEFSIIRFRNAAPEDQLGVNQASPS
jgi:hypothetical protein